jgi:hypothetical protein
MKKMEMVKVNLRGQPFKVKTGLVAGVSWIKGGLNNPK